MRAGRRLAALGLAAVLGLSLLAGCGAGEPAPAAESLQPDQSAGSGLEETAAEELQFPQVESPEELADLSPADFAALEEEYPTQYSTYTLLTGQELERTVYVLEGEQEGPAIYIVGGTHGDELAGWYAGVLLRQATVKAGTVYVLAPFNQYGAEKVQRKTKDGYDLNRHFPGDPQGKDADQLAAALYGDLEEKRPDFVLDLHEALLHTDGRDNLGNSIICQDIQPIADLVLSLLDDSDGGALELTHALDLYGSPPQGSLNNVVTQQLGIPVITVETSREEELGARIFNQLHIAEYVLEWYGLR